MEDKYSPEELDALIEAALKSEPMRPVPVTLQRRVDERLRIGEILDQERSRFRYSMATMTIAFFGALAAGVFFVAFFNLRDMIANGLPGGMGMADYYTSSVQSSWTGYSGAYSLIVSLFLAMATLLVGLIPLRKLLKPE